MTEAVEVAGCSHKKPPVEHRGLVPGWSPLCLLVVMKNKKKKKSVLESVDAVERSVSGVLDSLFLWRPCLLGG